MTSTQIQQINHHLELFLTEKKMSASQFSDYSGVGESYISHIRNGKTSIKVGEKESLISDKYYKTIAGAIGLQLSKNHWKPIATSQMAQILSTLEDAKDFGYTNIIIGETGCGKSYVSNLFCNKNPKDHLKITVGSTDTINDLLDKMCEILKLPLNHSKSKKIGAIIKELKNRKLEGKNPILIFDEAEYMKQATLCNMKELHDHLYQFCGLVMIGTNQLETKLDKLRKKNRDGIPQFYRRIKFGIRRLNAVDTSFKDFLKEHNITDRGLVKWLQSECDNYGELHDVLVPALREADRTGEDLSENFIKKVLHLAH